MLFLVPAAYNNDNEDNDDENQDRRDHRYRKYRCNYLKLLNMKLLACHQGNEETLIINRETEHNTASHKSGHYMTSYRQQTVPVLFQSIMPGYFTGGCRIFERGEGVIQ